MLKNYKAAIFILLVSFQYCTPEEKGSISVIKLGQSENIAESLFNIIEIVDLHPLVVPDSLTFGVFERGIDTGKSYVFNDGIYKGNFIVFDSAGMYRNSFSRAGLNPDQYSEITSFTVQNDERIIVHDYQKQRFTYYDETGKYLGKDNIGYNFRNFLTYKDYMYLFTAKHVNKVEELIYNYDLLILKNDSIVKAHLPFNPDNFQTSRIHNPRPFSFSAGKLYFNDMLSDTIYQVEGLSLHPEYVFRYNGQTISDELRFQKQDELIAKMMNGGPELVPYDLLANLMAASDEYLIFSYLHKMNVVYGAYDIKSGKVREFRTHSLTPEIGKIFESFKIDEEGNFISIVPVYAIKFLLSDENETSKLSKMWLDRLNSFVTKYPDPDDQFIFRYKIQGF